jgi:L-malate glycosyltransferase
MQICFFTENFYKGGLDTFLINLFNAWPDQNDELTLLCNASHPGLDTIEKKTTRALYITRYSQNIFLNLIQGQHNSKYVGSILVSVFFVLIQYLILFPWHVLRLTVYFWRSDFERLMVVNGGYPASLRCRCAAIAWRLSGKQPLAVFNFHNSATMPPIFLGVLENIIDRILAWSTSKFVSVSEDCLSSLQARKVFLNNLNLSYIYNGIEDPVAKINKNSLRDKVENERYCLLLATYESRKGHTYLLKAFKKVVDDFPDVHLYIYGDGKDYEKNRVTDEVKSLGLENNVTLNDFTPDTASLIANASAMLVPSQAYESFGLTIIEAMAFGIPVVATDVGGMPEVLAHSGAGYICSKDDPKEFSVAVKKILGNPSLALKLGFAGRQTFERRFMASKMASDYRKLLERLI